MKIELPLETWTELFGFVPRFQLVQLVPHIGKKLKNRGRKRQHQQFIGDRQFVSFVQFFLHKYSEVTLGQLYIYSSDENEPIIIDGKLQKLPLADVPIPENVKNFELIHLNHYDESVIAFLQKFQQNSLFDNVNLCFFNCPDFLQIMTNYLPLFPNINSIAITNYNSDVMDQLQCEYSESELAMPMLKSARVLFADYNFRASWFCNWLHIPREDGKPRVLILDDYSQDDCSFSHFIEHIKKDFLEANQAVTFFIKLEKFRGAASAQSLTLENRKTLEKLVIKRANGDYDPVTISRYPMWTNEEEWVEEMSQHLNTDNRTIEFD